MRRSKYGALPTMVDGIKFPSKKEAKRYSELKLLLHAGAIRQLILQPVYRIYVKPFVRADVAEGEIIQCGKYIGDFQYEELLETGGRWEKVVEDTKGYRTPIYRLKKRLVEALYGITIREI